MAGAARFVLDWLVEDPTTGRLVGGPTSSPENTFILPDGRRADVSMGTSMDQWIMLDLLRNTVDAARVLGRTDDPLVRECEQAIDRLHVPAIGADGRLMEWMQPWADHSARRSFKRGAVFGGGLTTAVYCAWVWFDWAVL